MSENEKPKQILLRDVPVDILEKIIEIKKTIMSKTKRTSVGDEEAIYKLIRNGK